MSGFKKAVRRSAKARVALIGPPGSGKTFTALEIAKGLGGTIGLIDSERGSASKYAGDVAAFDACDLDAFGIPDYIKAIDQASEAGYDVLIVDSISQAWQWALEQVDRIARARPVNNKFVAWGEVTPMQTALVDRFMSYPGHVIVTMRSKMAYEIVEDERGKKVPRKLGMAPIQRDGIEYEFDIVADMDLDHRMIVTKSRCIALTDYQAVKPGAAFAKILREWCDGGAIPAGDIPKDDGKDPFAAPSPKEAEGAEFERLVSETGAIVCMDTLEAIMRSEGLHIARLPKDRQADLKRWIAKIIDDLNAGNKAEWESMKNDDADPPPKPYYITREDLKAAWDTHVIGAKL